MGGSSIVESEAVLVAICRQPKPYVLLLQGHGGRLPSVSLADHRSAGNLWDSIRAQLKEEVSPAAELVAIYPYPRGATNTVDQSLQLVVGIAVDTMAATLHLKDVTWQELCEVRKRVEDDYEQTVAQMITELASPDQLVVNRVAIREALDNVADAISEKQIVRRCKGLGEQVGWDSNMGESIDKKVAALSTAQAMLALVYAGKSIPNLERSVNTLVEMRNGDGWVMDDQMGEPSVLATSYAVQALSCVPVQVEGDVIAAGARWLEAARIGDTGAWGQRPNSTIPSVADTAIAARTLRSVNGTSPVVDAGCLWLAASQRIDHGWGAHLGATKSGPGYTAHAILALSTDPYDRYREQVVNGLRWLVGHTQDKCEQYPWDLDNEPLELLTQFSYTHFTAPWVLAAFLSRPEAEFDRTLMAGLGRFLDMRNFDGRTWSTRAGDMILYPNHDAVFCLKQALDDVHGRFVPRPDLASARSALNVVWHALPSGQVLSPLASEAVSQPDAVEHSTTAGGKAAGPAAVASDISRRKAVCRLVFYAVLTLGVVVGIAYANKLSTINSLPLNILAVLIILGAGAWLKKLWESVSHQTARVLQPMLKPLETWTDRHQVANDHSYTIDQD